MIAQICLVIAGLTLYASQAAEDDWQKTPLAAEEISRLPSRVTDQGLHQQKVELYAPNGKAVSRYTELSIGGFREKSDGSWERCSPEVELFEGGAIARKTQYTVIFSPSSDDPKGVFDILTRDQKRLRGQCVGLAYSSRKTGKSAFIAEVKDVPGVVVGENEVFYPNTFSGGIEADVRYRVQLHAFNQDIILRSQLPHPEEYGFEVEDTVLEVWTEFLEAPEAFLTPRGGDTNMLQDVDISFGAMEIGPGLAFPFLERRDQGSLNLGNILEVKKIYPRIENMQFLVEMVSYSDLSPQLRGFPEAKQANADTEKVKEKIEKAFAIAKEKGSARSKPVALLEKGKNPAVAMAMIKKGHAEIAGQKGYVIDFPLSTGDYTNYVFQADETYQVTGVVALKGNTVIEGGTVIKFDRTVGGTDTLLNVSSGTVTTKTDPYRPAFFVPKDDNTIGAVISGSSGNVSGYYAHTALRWRVNGPVDLSGLHIRSAYFGVDLGPNNSSIPSVIKHSQILSCGHAVNADTSLTQLRNVLIHNCLAALGYSNSAFTCENVSFSRIGAMLQTYGYTGVTFAFTNSIFANVTNLNITITGANNVTGVSDATVFQEVGAGMHYLAPAYRNSGTVNIHPGLLADLKKRTTIPPLVLSNVTLSANQDFFPVVDRDIYAVDPGYHYAPLDWMLSRVVADSSVVTIRPGTVIGTFGTNGLSVTGTASIQSLGTAEYPVIFSNHRMVQESAFPVWAGAGAATHLKISSNGPAYPAVSLNFTRFHHVQYTSAGERNLSIAGGTNVNVKMSHCEFFGGGFDVDRAVLKATNCLFSHQQFLLQSAAHSMFQNCTFYRGYGTFTTTGGWLATFSDNYFDRTTLISPGNANHAYNAYVNGYNRLTPAHANDVVLPASMGFVPGPYGNFYQESAALLNKGSSSAANVGLYHFTSQSSGARETNSLVDIGYHYPYAGNGPPKVRFLTTETTTQGNWKGVYGSLGHQIFEDSFNFPSYFSATSYGYITHIWDAAPVSTLALQRNATGRIAAARYAFGSYEIAMTQSDSVPRRFAFYCLDWDSTTRVQTVEIRDGVTGAVLDSRSVSVFNNGKYLVWEIYGNFTVRVTNTGTPNAVLSGFFISPGTWVNGGEDGDNDDDGVPDYLEDVNGNGLLDSGETSFMSATDPGLKVFITQPKSSSNIP